MVKLGHWCAGTPIIVHNAAEIASCAALGPTVTGKADTPRNASRRLVPVSARMRLTGSFLARIDDIGRAKLLVPTRAYAAPDRRPMMAAPPLLRGDGSTLNDKR